MQSEGERRRTLPYFVTPLSFLVPLYCSCLLGGCGQDSYDGLQHWSSWVHACEWMGAMCACPFPLSSICLFSPKFFLPSCSILYFSLHPFRTCAWKCMLGHVLYSSVATHSAKLRSTQGTIPLWPQWLITFSKANRVLLVWINLSPHLGARHCQQ